MAIGAARAKGASTSALTISACQMSRQEWVEGGWRVDLASSRLDLGGISEEVVVVVVEGGAEAKERSDGRGVELRSRVELRLKRSS